jgi:hypothetical protein
MQLIKLTMLGTREQASPLSIVDPREAPRMPVAVDERDVIAKELWLHPEEIRCVTVCDALPMAKSAVITIHAGAYACAEEPSEIARLIRLYA